MTRYAKIVATIGPSCEDTETLRKLILAGVDVARLNFSHGTHDEHAARIANIRRLSEELHKPVTILQDLQGPKLRVGDLPEEGIPLKQGQEVILTPVDENGKPTAPQAEGILIPLHVPNLARSVKPGNHILLDDGQLEFEVIRVEGDAVYSRVILGGLLKSHKGVNLPGANLGIPGFTEKDREDLEFGLSQAIDAVAISFVRSAADVETVRAAIKSMAPSRTDTPIIAKMELPEAIDNMHEIIHAADGVMVARGDLGVEMSPQSVPIIQKKLIDLANRHAKIVITATQMLDSMIHSPRPTRAEASDVANAVLDGTDAVMLSGETASGSYPVESVAMMHSIICEAEKSFSAWGHPSGFPEELDTQDDTTSMTSAARALAHDANVASITVFTESGRTALMISKSRPDVPIYALTPQERSYNRMGLYWGVMAFLVPFTPTVDSMLARVEEVLVSSTNLQPGQQVVIITGYPLGTRISPNLALLHTLGD
ncbi:pyruvate kinase [Longilinea arvoryzae]|uniref:Pyruvate kinase n=1 Tax=Longilinea arvoryzae TaxID=360412 RepID=A0A0S7BHL8_9CHLR|nr:pyruvate kinase [Longilinea arvoryzae]GAP14580.1 pyruvate kinase [Longilinea arvoryzae]